MKIIAAYDDNRCMGYKGKLPWDIPEDLDFFKTKTWEKIIVMGRKTWESLPTPMLPHRHSFVLSTTIHKKRQWSTDRTTSLTFVKDWVNLLNEIRWVSVLLVDTHGLKPDVYVIGGTPVYQMALETGHVDEMVITKVHGVHCGDTYFPLIPPEQKWNVRCTDIQDNFERLEFTRV